MADDDPAAVLKGQILALAVIVLQPAQQLDARVLELLLGRAPDLAQKQHLQPRIPLRSHPPQPGPRPRMTCLVPSGPQTPDRPDRPPGRTAELPPHIRSAWAATISRPEENCGSGPDGSRRAPLPPHLKRPLLRLYSLDARRPDFLPYRLGHRGQWVKLGRFDCHWTADADWPAQTPPGPRSPTASRQ